MNLEGNTYLDAFTPTLADELSRLSEIKDNIEQERGGWINSGASEQFALLHVQAFEVNPELIPPAELKEIALAYQSAIFGTLETKGATNMTSNKVWGQLPAKTRATMMEIGKACEEHKNNFHRAIKPLTEERDILEQKAYDKWLGFVTQGLQPLTDFLYFLINPSYELFRTQQRPFLEALARKTPKVAQLEQEIGQRSLVNILANPEIATFSKFLNHLSSQRPNKQLDITVSWLRLISFPSEEIDTEKVFTMIQQAGFLPPDLKDHLTGFLKTVLTDNLLQITQELSDYKVRSYNPITIVVPTTNLVRSNHIKGATGIRINSKVVHENQELPPAPTYKLVLTDKPTTPEELKLFIEKSADGFAANDQRVQRDITKMIDAVTKDPFGLGTTKLIDKTTPAIFNLNRVPIRRLRPDKRPGLNLEYPNSPTLRVVFHIEKNDGENIIVLHEVLDHGDYDRKYGS